MCGCTGEGGKKTTCLDYARIISGERIKLPLPMDRKDTAAGISTGMLQHVDEPEYHKCAYLWWIKGVSV